MLHFAARATVAGLLAGAVLLGLEAWLGAIAYQATGPALVSASPLVLALALAVLLAAVVGGALRFALRPRAKGVGLLLLGGVTLALGIGTAELFAGPRVRFWPLASTYSWMLGLTGGLVVEGWRRIALKRPHVAALAALMVGIAAFAADARVHVGRYPAFHALATALTALGLTTAAWLVAAVTSPRAQRIAVAVLGVLVVGGSIGVRTLGSRSGLALRTELNLRTVQLWRLGLLVGPAQRVAPELDAGRLAAEAADDLVRQERERDAHRAWVAARRELPIPSVLLVTLDAWRADSGPDGPRAADLVPGIGAWAADAFHFTRAYSPAVTTYASFRSILAGRHPDTFPLGDAIPPTTFAGELRARGWRTGLHAGVGILDERIGQWRPEHAAAFDAIDSDLTLERMVPMLERLARRDGEREPWFAWFHVMELHRPYDPPRHFLRGSTVRDHYEGEIRFVDHLLAPVLTELAERDDVVVILSADHGEDMVEEHGFTSHGAGLYEPAIHVPLLIRARGVAPGRSDELVSLVDLFPTILGFAGVDVPPLSDGISLGPALAGDPVSLAAREAILAERRAFSEDTIVPNPMRALVRRQDKLIVTQRPYGVEVYDLTSGGEDRSLVGWRPDRVADLERALARALRVRERRWAPAALGRDLTTVRGLRAAFAAASPEAARDLAELVASSPAPELGPALADLVGHADPVVAGWCAVALGRLADDAASWPAAVALRSPSESTTRAALDVLNRQPTDPGLADLVVATIDPSAPSETWRGVVVLNRLCDSRGLVHLETMLRRPERVRDGLYHGIYEQAPAPRAELLPLLERHAPAWIEDRELAMAFLNIAGRLPGEPTRRLLDGVAVHHGRTIVQGAPLAHGLVVLKTHVEGLMKKAVEDLRRTADDARWGDGPYPVAWEIVAGVSFVLPAPRALIETDWGPVSQTASVRPLGVAATVVTLPESASRSAILQVESSSPFALTIEQDGQPLVDRRVAAGARSIRFALPDAPPGVRRLRIAVDGAVGVRFRELALIPD